MENKELVEQYSVINYSQDQVDLIKQTIAKDATNLELQMFLAQCKRTGLDAITRQIYFIKSNGKVQVQTSIDGFRLIAERSGDYEGQTKPEWCGLDGVWKDIWFSHDVLPAAARIGVWKRGFREALYAVAIFDEYAQRSQNGDLAFMWNKMPSLMISKVAESLALRKAFPNQMSGIYTIEELPQEDQKQERPMTTQKNYAPKIEKTMPASEYESFKPVTVATAKPETTLATGIASERNEMSKAINFERARLKWGIEDVKAFVFDNFGKQTIGLTIDEMDLLIQALRKRDV